MTFHVIRHGETGEIQKIENIEPGFLAEAYPGFEVVGEVPEAFAPIVATVEGDEIVEDLTRDWANLRSERDRRLLACDWTDLPNSPVTTEAHADWLAFRQSLRDLPAATVDPRSPDWPSPPA